MFKHFGFGRGSGDQADQQSFQAKSPRIGEKRQRSEESPVQEEDDQKTETPSESIPRTSPATNAAQPVTEPIPQLASAATQVSSNNPIIPEGMEVGLEGQLQSQGDSSASLMSEAIDSTKHDVKVAELEAQLRRQGEELSSLTSKVSTLAMCEEKIAKLEAQRRSQGQEVYRLTSEASALDSKLQQTSRKFQDARARNKDLIDQANISRRELDTLKSDRAAIISQNQQLNEDLRRLQQTSFSILDDARWMPLDTSAIIGEFSRLRKAINGLAKSNAVEDFSGLDSMPEERILRLLNQLMPTVRFEADGIDGLKELEAIRHAPRLCLSSLISNAAHKQMIERPFFLLELDTECEAENGSKFLAEGGLKELSTLYSAFAQHDEKKAQLWRSDTLRLLNPLHLCGTERGQKQLKNIEEAVGAVAKRLAGDIARNQLDGLLRTMDEDTLQKFVYDLAQIFVQAGQMSLKLWCQRPVYRCQYLVDLVEQPFLTSTQILQPHPLHKHSDPLDTALDGKLTKILIHPAVLSFGTHEAEDYDRSQILEKAVVWLDA